MSNLYKESVLRGKFAPNASHLKITAKDAADIAMGGNGGVEALRNIGVYLDSFSVSGLAGRFARRQGAMDSGLTHSPAMGAFENSSIANVQFLQQFLPGLVAHMTSSREIDRLVGLNVVGSWEDEEIIQGVMELVGAASLYGDYANSPIASYNARWERRTITRWEISTVTTKLESLRADAIGFDNAQIQRLAAASVLEILRNRIGFYGFNDGQGQTFGLLNEPALLPAITAKVGAKNDTLWTTKDTDEIIADISSALYELSRGAQGNIDAETAPLTLVLPIGYDAMLDKTNVYGRTARIWLSENRKNIKIKYAPELAKAVNDENVMYLYAGSVEDANSTDDGDVWSQLVPTKIIAIGALPVDKGFKEIYSNALAGVLLKRPYAVSRVVGV